MPHQIKHGMHASPENLAWRKMKDRCCNPRSQRFARYGGRGIRVCDRWMHSFESFFADMGTRPSPDHSIERIDNNGNYEPSNCKWATREEQNSNKSGSVILEHAGKRQTLKQWAVDLGIHPKTLGERLRAGWTVTAALSTPPENRHWKKSPRGSTGSIPADNNGIKYKRRRRIFSPPGGRCASAVRRFLITEQSGGVL